MTNPPIPGTGTADRDIRKPDHPSPQVPPSDSLPPYTPGGVPPPARDEKGNPDRLKPSFPPKRKA